MDAICDADTVGARVPHKLSVDILRRLPPRMLAESRMVCRKWRAAVDDNDLLPASYHDYSLSFGFVRYMSNHNGRWELRKIGNGETNKRQDMDSWSRRKHSKQA